MQEALHAYGKTLKMQSKQFIAKSAFDFSKETVTLKLVNQTLMELYQEMKQDILNFLRAHLQNNLVQLDAVLTAETKEAKPRTEEEKYKAMIAKNPALKDLKEDLGLDLVY